MDISNFAWWQQRTPRTLRPNCLLTRYPICFVKNPDSLLESIDPWNGIPQFLKNHGYDVKVISKLEKLPARKSHLVIDGNLASHFMKSLSQGADQTRNILSTETSANMTPASVTLIDPIFDLLTLVDLENLVIPPKLLFGSLFSINPQGPFIEASQRIAKTWGPSFRIYEGSHKQIRGRAPRPLHSISAHEFFLQHCIFLAEHDLTTAE